MFGCLWLGAVVCPSVWSNPGRSVGISPGLWYVVPSVG